MSYVVNWTKTPENPNDLPWEVKAGKRMLWSVFWEAHGEWPERRFTFCGSIKHVVENNPQCAIVEDKMAGPGTGVYYTEGITAYAECPAPFKE